MPRQPGGDGASDPGDAPAAAGSLHSRIELKRARRQALLQKNRDVPQQPPNRANAQLFAAHSLLLDSCGLRPVACADP